MSTEFKNKLGLEVVSRGGFAQSASVPQFHVSAPDGTGGWGIRDGNFYGVPETTNSVPVGVYKCCANDRWGPYLQKMPSTTDSLIEMQDSPSHALLEEFCKFWDLKDRFKSRGFLLKRGFLLWGPPGSGKTSTLNLLSKRLISDYGGVVLLVDDPNIAMHCFSLIRAIEPSRPLIAIYEDLDALVQRYGEAQLLALLDGEAHVDGIVNVATTNYPERLDPRFCDRPSRFDTITKVGMPNDAARRAYLVAREPELAKNEVELRRWVKVSEGLSMAHLKEMIIAVFCLGQTLDHVMERLEDMKYREADSKNNGDGKRKVGFA